MIISFKVIVRPSFPEERVFTLECTPPEGIMDISKWARLVFEMEQKLNELGYIRVHGDIRHE